MGKSPKNQTVTNVTKLPEWVDEAAQANLKTAQEVAENMPGPYQGNLVAGFSDKQWDAWNSASTAYRGAGQVNRNALGVLGQVGSATPGTVTAQMISGIPDVGARDVGVRLNAGAKDIAATSILGQQRDVAGTNVASNNIAAKTFSKEALSPYMDPYVNDVVNAGMSDLDRARQASLVQTGDQAAAAGAFGGSRQAIREGVTNAESARAAGALSANLRSQAFNTAAGLLGADNDRTLTADRSNQASSLAAAQSNQANALEAARANQATTLAASGADQTATLNAAQSNQAKDLSASTTNQASWLTADRSNQASTLAADQGNQSTRFNVAKSNQDADLDAQKATVAAALESERNKIAAANAMAGVAGTDMDQQLRQASVNEGIGSQHQQYQQALLNQDAARYEANRQFPIEKLNLQMQALGMTPYGQTSTSTGPATTQGKSPLLGALGGASTGASIASALGASAGGAGSWLGTLIGGLAGLSDKNDKKDIQKLGTDPETGLPMYAYRYKDAAANTPKVVGPMAQDVEKKFPGSTKKIGGHMVIKGGFLSGRGL